MKYFTDELQKKIKERYSTKGTRSNFNSMAKYFYDIMKIELDEGDFDLDDIEDNKHMIAKHLKRSFKDKRGKKGQDEDVRKAISTGRSKLGYLKMLFVLEKRPLPKPLEDVMLYSNVRFDKISKQRSVEKEEHYKMTELINFFFDKIRKSLSSRQRYLLISILSQVPLRLNEFENMTYNKSKTHNYIDMEKKQFIIRDHKTSKSLGTKKIPIPSDIFDIIVKHKKDFDYKYLFVKNRYRDLSMNGKDLESFLRTQIKAFAKANGKKLIQFGIHKIRHQFTSNYLNNQDTSSDDGYDRLKHVIKYLGHKDHNSSEKFYQKTKIVYI